MSIIQQQYYLKSQPGSKLVSMNLGSDDEAGPGLGVERQRSVDTASPGRRRRRGRRQSDVVKVI